MSWAFLAFHSEMPEPQSVTDFLLIPGRVSAVMARVIVLLLLQQAPFLLL